MFLNMDGIFPLFYVFNILLLNTVTSAHELVSESVRKHGCLGSAWVSSESDRNGFHFENYHGKPFEVKSNSENNYAFRLNEPLTVGQTVHIRGTIGRDGFAINFVKHAPQIDLSVPILFHMRVRFDDKIIVFNNAENGQWIRQEIIRNTFWRGQFIDIQIRAMFGKFEIYLNQEKRHEFEYRHKIDDIKHLVINSGLKLEQIPIISGRRALLPMKMDLPNHVLKTNETVRISGIATGRNCFTVNLINEKDDLIFHFSIDFNSNLVKRNTFVNGHWQVEERGGKNPFKKDSPFLLELINESTGIKVLVDGKHFTTYKHRTPLPTSDYVKIQFKDEVDLTGLEICTA